MNNALRRSLSHLVGWLADRRIPRPLRPAIYRTFARLTGAELSEVRPPLDGYPSLGSFFVRRLVQGARPFPQEPDALPSPVDGCLQSLDRIQHGSLLQAKGQAYPVRDLLDGVGEEVELEGGWAFTIYLSPRDYHRIHSPLEADLLEARWTGSGRRSVAPRVLLRRSRVLCTNERVALHLETPERRPFLLVLVGALNVGRIRVVGVSQGQGGKLATARRYARGEELARFEMGSTIVLLFPPGRIEPNAGLQPGARLHMGSRLGRLLS